MNFNKAWPSKSGWYWYVDKAYPDPHIGYVMGDLLHAGNREYPRYNLGTDKFIRIGDKVVKPECSENEVEA